MKRRNYIKTAVAAGVTSLSSGLRAAQATPSQGVYVEFSGRQTGKTVRALQFAGDALLRVEKVAYYVHMPEDHMKQRLKFARPEVTPFLDNFSCYQSRDKIQPGIQIVDDWGTYNGTPPRCTPGGYYVTTLDKLQPKDPTQQDPFFRELWEACGGKPVSYVCSMETIAYYMDKTPEDKLRLHAGYVFLNADGTPEYADGAIPFTLHDR